jgi:hypothetical protein
MTNELQMFVREALERKIPRPDIRKALLAAGWQDDQVTSALKAYAEVDFPIAVPRYKPYFSARETFIYLLLFVCLYISAFNFGALLFNFINRWLPDLQNYGTTDVNGVRMSVASLVVAFPLYLWLTSIMLKAIRQDSEKKSSKIRKWLTYLTLFIAASIIIGDLITLLFNLLGGELTLRFMLKVLTVLVIAGLIFGYYLWDLRKEEKEA